MSVVHRYSVYKNNHFHPDISNPEQFIVMANKAKYGVMSVRDVYDEDEQHDGNINCPWCGKLFSFDQSLPSSFYYELADGLTPVGEEEGQTSLNYQLEDDKEYDWYALLICPTCRKMELMLEKKMFETNAKESKGEDDGILEE